MSVRRDSGSMRSPIAASKEAAQRAQGPSLPDGFMRVATGTSPGTSIESTSGTGPRAQAPPGFYSRYGRTGCELVLLALSIPPACVLGAGIAVANAIAFGDWRKVFFVQERVGRGAEPFRIYKFRTMSEGAGSEPVVSRFGRLLRNTHLDELPQILNVLKGDMSFVGPRPEMTEIHRWACEHVEGFDQRLAVRPGITGLAQVTQGYAATTEEDYERKFELDLDYVTRRSFALDLWIVLRTFGWMAARRGWRPRSGSSL